MMPDFGFSDLGFSPAASMRERMDAAQDWGQTGPSVSAAAWASAPGGLPKPAPPAKSAFAALDTRDTNLAGGSDTAAAKMPPAAPVTGVIPTPYTVHNDGSCWKLTAQQKGPYYTAAVPETVPFF